MLTPHVFGNALSALDQMSIRSHACFRLEIRFPIALPTANSAEQLWEALTHHIMREPNDLLAHTRRVRLCRNPSLNERLPGALHDLHVITRGGAAALRQRLLDETQAMLSEHMRSHFAQALSAPDENPTLAGESFPGSVLPTLVHAKGDVFARPDV